jgi:ATP-dependent protease ClpP protease subunit
MHDTRYRFHGRNAPTARARTPVLRAEVGAAEGDAPGQSHLYIYDPIDSWGDFWGVSAKEVIASLAALPADTSDIQLHLNSPGGEVFEGIAILNALRNHPAKVTAVVDGLAASAASFIAAGVDELVMGQNTSLMIHDAWGIAIGPEEDMLKMGALLGQMSNNIAAVYQQKAGGALDDWRALMLEETWYLPEQAVAAGLADRVAGEAPEAAAQNAFDLAGLFKYAGADAAPEPRALGQRPTKDESSQFAARHGASRHKLAAARHGLSVPA